MEKFIAKLCGALTPTKHQLGLRLGVWYGFRLGCWLCFRYGW